jgi:hypothetical protein
VPWGSRATSASLKVFFPFSATQPGGAIRGGRPSDDPAATLNRVSASCPETILVLAVFRRQRQARSGRPSMRPTGYESGHKALPEDWSCIAGMVCLTVDVPLPVVGMFLTWPAPDSSWSRQRSWGFPFAVLLLPAALEGQITMGQSAPRHPRLPWSQPRPDRFHREINRMRWRACARASATEFVENSAVPTRERRGSPAGLAIRPNRDHSCPFTGTDGSLNSAEAPDVEPEPGRPMSDRGKSSKSQDRQVQPGRFLVILAPPHPRISGRSRRLAAASGFSTPPAIRA